MHPSRVTVRAHLLGWGAGGLLLLALCPSCRKDERSPAPAVAPVVDAGPRPGKHQPTKPVDPPGPTPSTSPLVWVPGDTTSLSVSPGAGVFVLEYLRQLPERPACLDATYASVRHSLQIQRALKEKAAIIALGAFDRDRIEACAVEVFKKLGMELTMKRRGWTTTFSAPDGSGVLGFLKNRVVYADTLDQLHAIANPPFRLGARSPLAPLVARFDLSAFGMAMTFDPVQRFSGVEAIGTVALGNPPNLDFRIVYRTAGDASRSLAALQRALASPGLPAGAVQVLRQVGLKVQGTDLRIDLEPFKNDPALLEQAFQVLMPMMRP